MISSTSPSPACAKARAWLNSNAQAINGSSTSPAKRMGEYLRMVGGAGLAHSQTIQNALKFGGPCIPSYLNQGMSIRSPAPGGDGIKIANRVFRRVDVADQTSVRPYWFIDRPDIHASV